MESALDNAHDDGAPPALAGGQAERPVDSDHDLTGFEAAPPAWTDAGSGGPAGPGRQDAFDPAIAGVQAQVDESLPPMPFNQVQCADLKGWHGGASHPGWRKHQGSVAAPASGAGGGARRGSSDTRNAHTVG